MAPPTALTALTVGGVYTQGTPFPIFTGTWYFCDYANGSDGNPGTAQQPFKTLSAAYGQCVAGRNDVVAIISDGTTASTQRLTSTFTWAKTETHLIGVCSPVQYSNRARIAPTTTATAFTPFITWSASGCYVYNVQIYGGFTTGTTSQICLSMSGGRNSFSTCHIVGMADTASAQSAGSRTMVITGSTGENLFIGCTFGVDTVARTQANATLEFASATPRNSFIDCTFPFMTSASTPLGYIGTGSGSIDRTTEFLRCVFLNAVGSTSTTMAGLGTLSASAGGALLFKDCTMLGISEFGTDATTRGQCWVDGGAPTAGSSGIAVNPT